MGKFNFGDSPVSKMAEEIRDGKQGRVAVPANTLLDDGEMTTAEPISEANRQMQSVAQPVIPIIESDEPLKNVGAKIPYSVYDRLERIKRNSERTGNRSDKRNIGDLIAMAVKEFVEKYDV